MEWDITIASNRRSDVANIIKNESFNYQIGVQNN
jgi:hypothetical protein